MGRTLIALTGLTIVFAAFSTAWTVQGPVAQQNHAVHYVLADNENPQASVS